MAHVAERPASFEEQLALPKKVSNLFLLMIGGGLVLLVLGIVLNLNMGHETAAAGHGAAAHGGGHEAGHHAITWINRLFANLWLNNIYFTGISVIGMFFISLQYVAYAYWSVPVKRVLESLTGYLPVGAVLMIVIFLLGKGYLFHWTTPGIMDPTNKDVYDPIIAGKSGYLNLPFFLIRMVVYLAIWVLFSRWMRAQSVAEDMEGGIDRYNKSIKIAAIFLVLFAVSNSMANWDWLMSIDTHWFSTMYSWYVFASWLVSGVSATILIAVNLKEAGYLRIMNANHLHDLGKFAFGFTIFWTYVWFAQFMLIWYANLPEEVTYFQERWFGHFAPLFYLSLIINFVTPFLLLMTRDAKRQMIMLKLATVVILSGHYIDFYMMVMPGTVGNSAGFGPMEIGTTLVFLGIFLTMVTRMLTSASLIQHQHPFIEESLHHHI
jgi:hypothetical protein